jgi:superfamily II RNA helicase
MFLNVINPSEPCTDMPSPLATEYTFPLDPFQQHAIAAIHKGENVLVTAKTGSGKTLVGEYLIHYTVAKGGRIFYTTPIKSLSNQKFNDLKKMFGQDRVGIMTGDIKFNPDAQIIVMTTEILRNLLYKQGTSTEHLGLTAALSLKNLQAVVFDEVHYINDRDRGRVWEETMILLPPAVQLILLSATISRPELFASWLGELKQIPCTLISTLYRIVPLTHGVLMGTQFQTLMDNKNIYHDDTYRRWLEWREKGIKDHEDFQRKVKEQRRAGYEGPVDGKARPTSFLHQMNETIAALEREKLLPALAFVFSRAGCERYAEKVQATLVDSSEAAKINHIWDFHLHAYKDTLETLPQAHKLKALALRGIGYHHSGLLPVLKEIIEILFSRGFIKMLFATETFAVGLNMPTKTVLFFGLEKYSDESMGLRPLRTDEYIQMAGRAGRRGLDPVGTVIYLPEREPVPASTMRSILTGGQAQIQSKMQFHYEFLLKSLQSNATSWLNLMEKSYWYLQRREEINVATREVVALEEKIVKTLLTPDDVHAFEEREAIEHVLAHAQNAKKKAAQRALEAWRQEHSGSKWDNAAKAYPNYKKNLSDLRNQKNYIRDLEAHKETIEPIVAFLTTRGFLSEGSLTKESLTERGVLATEINEGHPILMTELYLSGLCADLTQEEIIAVLACFMGEDKKDTQPSLEKLAIPTQVKKVLYSLGGMAQEFLKEESQYAIQSPDTYWELSTTWIEPMYRWSLGDDASILCRDYDLFEGNLLRSIMKCVNLLEEWAALATFKKDVLMLDKLRGIEQSLKRNIATSDSLYLRL